MKDLTGKRFGKLIVIRPSDKDGYWLCNCDCGKQKIVFDGGLRNGHTRSCGCLKIKATKERSTTHGKSNTKIYRVWRSMIARCEKKNSSAYRNYGARGITVCGEWHEFMTFYNWAIQNGYKNGLTIDRVNNDGNYEPLNCRWLDRKSQCRNTRVNKLITYNGQTRCVSEWAEITGINAAAIFARLNKLGWDAKRALTEPIRCHK